ncbi:uncharacterized protein LOC119668680 [Teleopsis dalmanni]|uniref:uncharacterized protein LOC119668680 n=1 Tax=Teleopsis dalmanni TaxID=139649 RepID=UPI0018CCFC4A|nr:uncharacterized protein LOC119668680 [Teleopsis dalmanni]XP_037934198.1 uncharacterized protein LOC119668680 [Teleopsis dalmanni]
MATFKLGEVKADLFHVPHTYSLAHAVSADFETQKGTLAWQFTVIFGQVDDLRKQHMNAGNVAVLEHNSRFVYFLVTKDSLYGKSTYDTVESALICLRQHMRNHGVSKVAMPRICCGNDKLNWSRVKEIIYKVFANEFNVEILICEHRTKVSIVPLCKIFEVRGNLFNAPPGYSLVHSVSADFAMCKGVGLQIKCKFGQVNELVKQNKHTGNVAVLKDNDRYIYNLITKERNHENCTYPALYYALIAMREHMLQHNVTKLAIPRLGCGIDRLSWLQVRRMLEFVFADDSVEVQVYFFEPTPTRRTPIRTLH